MSKKVGIRSVFLGSNNIDLNEEKIVNLNVHKVLRFRQHNIFSLYDKEKSEEMKNSIKENGILEPIIVREIDDDFYEILAGHNRVRCAEELGMETVPAKIVECDDNKATLIMLETNLCNRDKILPVDKGFAYKLRNKILKEMKKEQEVAPSELDKSKTQIFRYIRLTELIKPLQDKVNREEMTIKVGTELSFLSKEKQYVLNYVLDNEKRGVNLEQAMQIRALGMNLDYDSVIAILNNESKENKFTGKLDRALMKKYKNKFTSNDEFLKLIDKLLEEYFK